MSVQRIGHGRFTIERDYEASPARVFGAWSDPQIKARWFIGPEGWTQMKRELDFRVGGAEVLHGRFAGGMETLYTARFHHIERDRRIVCVYDMHLNGMAHSTSLATVELLPERAGTRLVFTEQVAFLDGTAAAEGTAARERGTGAHLDRLAAQLHAGG